MHIKTDHRSFFVFDLDDTLYREIDFLHSGYRTIARVLEEKTGTNHYADMVTLYQGGGNVFEWIISNFRQQWPDLAMPVLLTLYREHMPSISLYKEAAGLLQQLKQRNIPAGLITDGRSITQRNKLKALGLADYFSDTIISEEFGSEKPDERNYRYFENKYPGFDFSYFGDNTTKDFIAPANLGWFTCCLKDDGYHIHPQAFDHAAFPAAVIQSFEEIQLT
ncbi:HAD family hydrolase [Paraflavitalea pollutisoli]|uniref:HAD family hydrolase n=1 Tax=Paraflavitalea pollutisoli TaxID=3034143 RepID=UPI0023EAFBA3|nr:HAD family hydrolase [Paraflavitalea sp. H1-2-19X]